MLKRHFLVQNWHFARDSNSELLLMTPFVFSFSSESDPDPQNLDETE